MRRIVVIAAVGVAVLAAGAIVAIAIGPGAPPTPPLPAPASDEPAAPPPVAATPGPPPAPAPRPQAPPRPVQVARPGPAEEPPPGDAQPIVVEPPPPEPPDRPWEAVQPAPRAAALGSIGAAVARELEQLQPKISACFDDRVQADYAHFSVSEVKERARAAEAGETVLMLEIETEDGKGRIVDAPLQTRGDVGDGVIACAQRVLRDYAFDLPGASAGRYRLPRAIAR